MDRECDFNEFILRIAALGEIFGKEIGKLTLKAYWSALEDLTWQEFETACNHLLKTAKFFPRPVEFREAVLPDPKAAAALAYDRTIEALGLVGCWKSVVFDDPCIMLVAESMGGWVALGEKHADEWLRKEFERLYLVHGKRIAVEGPAGVPSRLPGRIEYANAQSKFSGQKPDVVFIGDRAKYEAWLALAGAPSPKSLPTLRLVGKNDECRQLKTGTTGD